MHGLPFLAYDNVNPAMVNSMMLHSSMLAFEKVYCSSSVPRSPGGTPIRQAPRPCVSNDPAALIAQALKKKFARQRAEESPDKENIRHNFTSSPKKLTPVKESPKVNILGKKFMDL